jgi:tRNA U34 5-methylaminomethyl-2-thiouridine-forming methyltransferase MnmC
MIAVTADGSATLWSERFGQHYHNRNGAMTQARHVYLEGSQTHQHMTPHVLEIGFGVGLNFLTTLQDATARGVPLHYLAFEFDPQPVAILRAIGNSHPAHHLDTWQNLLERWPAQPISMEKLVCENAVCSLEIRFADASMAALPTDWATAVYLDGFSPDANPELWTPDFIAQLAKAMQPGAWVATYSAAGTVKRAMASAGLDVMKRPGIAGKRECLHALKSIAGGGAP